MYHRKRCTFLDFFIMLPHSLFLLFEKIIQTIKKSSSKRKKTENIQHFRWYNKLYPSINWPMEIGLLSVTIIYSVFSRKHSITSPNSKISYFTKIIMGLSGPPTNQSVPFCKTLTKSFFSLKNFLFFIFLFF